MTREVAKRVLKSLDYYLQNRFEDYGERNHDAMIMAIKALEQEDILDKIRAEIIDTLYVDSLIFGELIDFKNGKISADDVIEEFNRVTRLEVLKIFDEYKSESEE